MIVTKLLAVVLACTAVPYAHYAGVAAHEAMHCARQVDGDACSVTLYRPPAAEEGGVDGSTEIDREAPAWHWFALAVEWLVYAAFLSPAAVAWSIRRKHG